MQHASEGVRAKQNELSVSVERVDLKLAKRALYLSGSRTANDMELLKAYQCGTQFGSHEWKVDPIWFTLI